jgi:hypothetical protein
LGSGGRRWRDGATYGGESGTSGDVRREEEVPGEDGSSSEEAEVACGSRTWGMARVAAAFRAGGATGVAGTARAWASARRGVVEECAVALDGGDVPCEAMVNETSLFRTR